MAEGEHEGRDGGLRVIRGDTLLARYLFGDPAQRRVIPALQADGWPIWPMAGKRAARSADLDAEAAERARAARDRMGPAVPKAKSKRRRNRKQREGEIVAE
jgi:hypothetical protein